MIKRREDSVEEMEFEIGLKGKEDYFDRDQRSVHCRDRGWHEKRQRSESWHLFEYCDSLLWLVAQVYEKRIL